MAKLTKQDTTTAQSNNKTINSQENIVAIEENNSQAARLKKQKAFNELMKTSNVWGLSQKGLSAVNGAMQMLSTKTGIYAKVPIHCKGDKCPYAEGCQILEYFDPKGEPCPIEIANIRQKYVQYYNEFNLMDSETASYTDKALVDEIITMEIYMERCKALMAKETSPVQMIAIGIDARGKKVEQPELSKSVEAYEKFSKKRNDNYRLLMATRQDKKHENKEQHETTMVDILNKAINDKTFYDIEQKPDA